LTCNTAEAFIMIATNICAYPSCSRGSYFNVTKKSCQSCPLGCDDCYDSLTCVSCIKGFLFDNVKKMCFDDCDKIGFEKDPVTKECLGMRSL
jgi:hypothetical protein